MSAPKGPRPLTQVITIIESAPFNAEVGGYVLTGAKREKALLLLTERDASSDTPDRKRRRPAKKAARR